jgi:hypothetical protein
MEARSQLRHRPTIEDEKPKPDEIGIEGSTGIIFAHITGIVNARPMRFWRGAARFARRDSRGGCPHIGLSATPQEEFCKQLNNCISLGFFYLFPQGSSGIIDRAPYLHNLSTTI